MKINRRLIVIILTSIFLSGCQITGNSGFNEGNTAATPVEIYSTPLEEFKPMQLTWFYKPPDNSSDHDTLAENFSLFILTRNDESEREEIRSLGYNGPVLQYLRAEAIMDPGNCWDKPYQNQVANLEGDYCFIKSLHPKWFLKDIRGNPVQYGHDGYLFMDPGNTGWQDFYLKKISGFQNDTGWQGVFLDNVDGSLGRFERMGLQLEQYADDQSYQNAVKSFLQHLYENYFAGRDNVLYANIPYLKDNNVWFDYLEFLDGAMLEAFAADWNTGYISVSDWLAQLELAEETQTRGKSILLVTQGPKDDIERMQFGLASFLLINNGNAYFRYSNADNYRELWWYSQYEIDLGQPLGPKYPDGDAWQRDFEFGSVRVSPEDHSAEILAD